MARASLILSLSQSVIACNIGLRFLAQREGRRRRYIGLVGRFSVYQPVEQVQHMGLCGHAGLQSHFHCAKHRLLVMVQNKRQNIDHLTVPTRPAQHLSLQLAEGLWHLGKGCPIAQRPGFALDHGQIMAHMTLKGDPR